VFVAEDGGRAIGFGSCGPQRNEALTRAGFGGEFGAIYVLRSHQGRGVGRSIMAALARALSAEGHGAAALWVLRDNAPARRFYERLGGIVVGEQIDEQPGATLVEDGYGWRDLSILTG
jgi:GNAT superfamily N-acetyltransferase